MSVQGINCIGIVAAGNLGWVAAKTVSEYYSARKIDCRQWPQIRFFFASDPQPAGNISESENSVLLPPINIVVAETASDLQKLVEISAFLIVISTRGGNTLNSENFKDFRVPESYLGSRTSSLDLGYSVNGISYRLGSILNAMRLGICVGSRG